MFSGLVACNEMTTKNPKKQLTDATKIKIYVDIDTLHRLDKNVVRVLAVFSQV